MASKFSVEFYVGEARLLLESSCRQALWPLLQNRIKTAMTCVKREAEAIKLTDTSHGSLEINGQQCPYSLTINPQGNKFR